jgi:osmoprotectant transport system permease protein
MNLDYLFDNWRRVFDLAVDHLQLSLVAMAIALAIAVPLGVLVAAVRPLSLPVMIALGIAYTIPSLAFLAFLIPWLNLGRKPAIAVLVVYAQLTLVRNIAAGLRGVDSSTIEAASGIGMTRWQVFRAVRLPLALPIVIAGIRIATVTTISLATITAWIGAGGLGTLLFDGISRDYPSQILAGAVAITALALAMDLFLRLLESLTPTRRAVDRGRDGTVPAFPPT